MKIIIFLFLILFPFLNFSQTEVYLDENMEEIGKSIYISKCESHIFKCLNYKTDTLIVHKTLYKYSFGKISNVEYHQIRNLLMSQSKKRIDSNSTILIKFSDTLQNLQILKNNYDKHVIVCEAKNPSINHRSKNLKSFVNGRKSWVKSKYKCIEKFKKKNDVSINYVYKYENNAITSYGDFDWIKDRGIFKNLFFRIMYQSNLLIVKPNGEYFLSGSHISDKSIVKLIRSNDWKKYKEDWQNSITTHLKRGKGFFNKGSSFHKDHCF